MSAIGERLLSVENRSRSLWRRSRGSSAGAQWLEAFDKFACVFVQWPSGSGAHVGASMRVSYRLFGFPGAVELSTRLRAGVNEPRPLAVSTLQHYSVATAEPQSEWLMCGIAPELEVKTLRESSLRSSLMVGTWQMVWVSSLNGRYARVSRLETWPGNRASQLEIRGRPVSRPKETCPTLTANVSERVASCLGKREDAIQAYVLFEII